MSFHVPELPLSEAGLVFAVLTVAVLLGPLLAKRLRVPDVVAVILLGFAIGPTGLGIVERAGVVEVLGSAGLLYLMFTAGLELDLDDFIENRRGSIVFGVLTFAFPLVFGTLLSLALDFSLLTSLVLGAMLSTHTLIAYPIFQRAGTVANRAVSTAVGATILVDTLALLVLAVVARGAEGALTPLFWVTLLPALAVVTLAAILGLPRLTTRFFSGPGQDPTLRFVFVLVALFVTASAFEVIGFEAIVGAFVAGLAMNRSVPNNGALMGRVEFFGSALLVPLFLLSTGMLIDVSVLTDPRTVLVGVSLTLMALVSKYAAAWAAGRIFAFERVEVLALYGLSNSRAAATLAGAIIGLNAGLLDTETVNAVVLIILVSCIVASAVSARAAPRLSRPDRGRAFGEVVVVPLANPATAPRLMRLASAFARADGGLVVPLAVSASGSDEQLQRLRELESDMVEVAQSAGAEARTVLRIDQSPESGIAHTVREQQGTLLVLGWKGVAGTRGSRFGGITDRVLGAARVPTLLTYDTERDYQRILVIVHEKTNPSAGDGPLRLALATARHLGRELGLPIEVVVRSDDADLRAAVVDETGVEPQLTGSRRMDAVRELAREDDLLVLPTPRDDTNLRIVASRVLRNTPEGAGLVIAISDGAPPVQGPSRQQTATDVTPSEG